MKGLLKQTLVVLASACAGFYLGARYTGGLVQEQYVQQKPNWMVQTQETMELALIALGILALAWIILDYRETST